VYGRRLDVPIDDMRRVFETNLWGVVYGSRIACEHLCRHGGALINMGSEVSDVAVPLQGIYSASKHAVKGWTDALRMELQHENAPVAVTLIKPGPIDTPYTEHAGNYLSDRPTHAPPVYSPQSVAEAVLYAATHPVRDLFVGGGARLMAGMRTAAPGMTDRMLERMMIPATHSGRPRRNREALHQAGGGLRVRGDYEGMVRNSTYTRAAMHPMLSAAIAAGVGFAALSAWRSSNQRRDWRAAAGRTHVPSDRAPARMQRPMDAHSGDFETIETITVITHEP